MLKPPDEQMPDAAALAAAIDEGWHSIGTGKVGLRVARRVQGRDTTDKYEYGAHIVDDLLDREEQKVWRENAIGSLYSSLIIGAYTAFEVLATDLWLVAVNERPKSLAKYALEFARGDTSEPKAARQEPSVLLSTLAAYDFNVSGAVGDFLRESNRVKFDSLNGIQTAYKAAFRIPEDKKKRVSNQLSELFKGAYNDLYAIEAVRNLMAHRGGKVDQKFLDQVKGYDAGWSATLKDQPLQLAGQQVSKLVLASVRFSSSLLVFVNDWLSKYTDSGPGCRIG